MERTRSISRQAVLVPLLMVSCFAFQGCGSGGGEVSSPPQTPAAVAPAITQEPGDVSVVAGQSATFSVSASGTAPLTYQWRRNGTDIGTNAANHTTAATTLADNDAKFTVTVSNAAGNADSAEATLTVTSAPVAPTITGQPQNRTVTVGQTAAFSVTASGTTPFTYLWKKNGSNVGGNSASYTTGAATAGDNNAKITVRVSNSTGHADSSEATLTVNPSTSSAIVIDHTNTDLPLVPSTWISAAKNNLKIAYGHTSHGSQLITGMDALAASNSLYAWNPTGTDSALKIHDYAMGGDVGYFPDWVNNTRSYLGTLNAATGRGSSHGDINVIIWSWCGQAGSRSQQEMIDTYLAPMTQLETDYPGIKFVYMTGHLDGSGSTGQLNQRNEQIRAYCRTNNKILFDFADIESYAPAGLTNYMELNCDDGCFYDGDHNGSRESNWATLWLGNNPTHPLAALASSCGACAHSQQLNCILKARAAWWLWARLAGWGG
jgi:hypothetical protein